MLNSVLLDFRYLIFWLNTFSWVCSSGYLFYPSDSFRVVILLPGLIGVDTSYWTAKQRSTRVQWPYSHEGGPSHWMMETELKYLIKILV